MSLHRTTVEHCKYHFYPHSPFISYTHKITPPCFTKRICEQAFICFLLQGSRLHYHTQYTFYFTQYTFLFYPIYILLYSIYVFILLNIRFYFTQYTFLFYSIYVLFYSIHVYFTQYTFYFTQYTFYFTQYTFYFNQYTFYFNQYTFILLNIHFYFLNIHCFVYLQKVLAPLNEGIHLSKDTALIQNPTI